MYIIFGSNSTAAIISDGDKGDLTVTGGSWVVDNDVVSNAKLAEMAAQAIKANPTGSSANPQDLAVSEGRVVGRITGGNVTGLTAAEIRTLINVEDGATADQTGAEIVTALNSEIGTPIWQQGVINTDGMIYKIQANGNIETYEPAGYSPAQLGDAAVTALGEISTGDYYYFGKGHLYELDAEVTVTLGTNVFATLDFNGATLKRADSANTDWVLAIEVGAGSILNIKNLFINGNRDNVTIDTDRGEGLRIDGDGQVYIDNVVSYDAPTDSPPYTAADSAAVGFFIRGTGHKRLTNCVAYNPSYANYRIQALSSEFINCDSLNLDHSGNKGRLWVMDGTAVDRCVIRGGIWQTHEAYEINSNFDPDSTFPDNLYCEDLLIDGVYMDFGISHTNTSGDSFIKFDNCRKVRVINCTQRHSQTGTVFEEDTPPNTYRYETWITIGLVDHFYMGNCFADASCKFSSPGSTIYTSRAIFENCEFGVNSNIGHALSYMGHCGETFVKKCRFYNLKGVSSGTFRSVFNNDAFTHTLAGGDQDHYLTVEDCYFQTDYADDAVFVNSVPALGSIAVSNVTIDDLGSTTWYSGSALKRLLGSVLPGDRKVCYLTRDMLGRNERYELSSTGVYAKNHMSPEDPGTDDGDWFGGLIPAYEGSIIINENADAGGNGFPRSWRLNASGNFVEDSSVTLY